MDDRKLQLKQLRKTANRAKRKYVTFWKVMGILFLLAAILVGVEHVFVKFLPCCITLYAIAGLLVLFLLTLIPWGVGKKKWKRTVEYLDYRTMKNTLRQEKKFR